jgi:putative lipoprotein
MVLFIGCSATNSQTPIQKVYVPVKCDVTIPKKPFFNPDDPQSLKLILIYYLQIENLLKGCVNG